MPVRRGTNPRERPFLPTGEGDKMKKLLILVAIVGIAAFAFSKMGSREPEI
jgi:hypothetical protein